MVRNLYLKELKRSRKNFLIWGAIVVGFTVMMTAMFPALEPMGESITGLMKSLPEELRKAFGMDDTTWGSILGFYGTYYGIYIIVLSGIYTTSTGATILTKEEANRTSEFLMTRPISRSQVYWTKMVALLTLVVAFFVIQYVTALIGMVFFGKGTVVWYNFHVMHAHGAALLVLFTGLGVLLSMLTSARANFVGIAVGLVFGSYFIEAFSRAVSRISILGYLSPFHYADFASTNPLYAFQPVHVVLLIALGGVFTWVGWKLFERKDFAT